MRGTAEVLGPTVSTERLDGTDFSRICRFGIKLFEHICKLGGATIVYTMDERQAKTSNETLVDDVLGVLTHFTAKASGEKAKKALKIVMDQEALQAGYRLYKEGYSFRHIHTGSF